MWSRLNLELALLVCVLIICAINIEDVGAGSIRKSNSSAITKPPRTPVIPTTPKRPKTLPPQSTPMRPKTLPVLSTPKRRQILPLLSTPKRPQFNQSVKNNTQLFATITTPKPVTRKPTPTEDSVCEDYNVKCRRWAQFGYCYNGYVRGYMKKSCKKSCRFCGHMKGKCRDNHYYCPSWTWRGGCQRHIAFMRLNCRHSCNVC